MSDNLAFVGDVHGNLEALEGIWKALDLGPRPHVVFLGDYINKGPKSAEALGKLIEWSNAGLATLLAGNHELALLAALETHDLTAFLKMGGAVTVRSYVDGRVGPDVAGELVRAVPESHLQALRQMPLVFESDGVIAQHLPSTASSPAFTVTAHIPVGNLPTISEHGANLDTGCLPNSGRLTALLWPSLNFVQVDHRGAVVSPD